MSRFANETRKMINEYYNEMAVVAEENARQALEDSKALEAMSSTHVEIDPLWDCWYDMAFLYEPECTKDDVQMTVSKDMEESNDFNVDDLFYDEPVYEPNSRDKRRERVSKRRKNAALHKSKVRRNVTIIWTNYVERERTDMLNHSYQKRKNGERIDNPKSQETKADNILKQAMKNDAVPEELREEIAKHLKAIRKYMSTTMENRISYERFCRDMELKVKQQLVA